MNNNAIDFMCEQFAKDLADVDTADDFVADATYGDKWNDFMSAPREVSWRERRAAK